MQIGGLDAHFAVTWYVGICLQMMAKYGGQQTKLASFLQTNANVLCA